MLQREYTQHRNLIISPFKLRFIYKFQGFIYIYNFFHFYANINVHFTLVHEVLARAFSSKKLLLLYIHIIGINTEIL